MDKFTDFSIVNPDYAEDWQMLVNKRELIAHMNPYRAVKSMKGVEMEKYHAMEHEYPSKVDVLKKFGYNRKQVHHLLRVEDYMWRYIAGESYINCLHPSKNIVDKLMAYKRQEIPLDIARQEANKSIAKIISMADNYCSKKNDCSDPEAQAILNNAQYNIMKKAITQEI